MNLNQVKHGEYYVKIKVFMNSAGNNFEREILRMMHTGIADKFLSEDSSNCYNNLSINKNYNKFYGVDFSYDEKYTKCDVAVMMGSWKNERSNVHHIVRTSIAQQSKCFICIETPLINRNFFQPNIYQRVGINGFLNKDAIFGEDIDYPSDRLEKLGIKFKGWKKNNGDKIVIALQLAGDASLRNNNINDWCVDTIKTLRNITDRPIEIRTHPGVSDKAWVNYNDLFMNISFNGYKNISFINGRNIPWEDQILDAYCVVAYTSGLSIDAIVNGIPVIACDEGNFAWNVGEKKLKNIEKLNLADENDVQQWLQNLAYCQWTYEEMETGKCWDHLRSSIDKVLQNEKDSNIIS